MVIELEKKSDYIETLENKVQILHQKLVQSTEETTTNVSNKVKAIEEEKRLLQVKHEKVCAEFKNLKREINELNFNSNASAVALKSAKKESKDATYRHEKKVELLEEKVKELEEFKTRKMAEEKEIKSKDRKATKKMRQIEEREAEVKLKIKELRKKLDTNANVKKEDNTGETSIEEFGNEENPKKTVEDEETSRDNIEAEETTKTGENKNKHTPAEDPFEKVLNKYDLARTIEKAFAKVEHKFDAIDEKLDDYLAE